MAFSGIQIYVLAYGKVNYLTITWVVNILAMLKEKAHRSNRNKEFDIAPIQTFHQMFSWFRNYAACGAFAPS